MDLLDIFSVSASGLTAQRVRLQAVSSNMANARSTRTEDGRIEPYRRQMLVVESRQPTFGDELDQAMAHVDVVEVVESDADPVLVFDPTHPDADQEGYVRYPNVNILEEMVDMMTSSRLYEANTNVVKTTRELADAALSIGR
jgi:flagellar basal-body rod protein FlgC